MPVLFADRVPRLEAFAELLLEDTQSGVDTGLVAGHVGGLCHMVFPLVQNGRSLAKGDAFAARVSPAAQVIAKPRLKPPGTMRCSYKPYTVFV